MNFINSDPLLDVIKNDIMGNYKCHTIILYGSRARGKATAMSDYDIVAIRDNGDFERDCRFFEILGIKIPVISRRDLLSYKKILARPVDLIDIQQIESQPIN